jgi:uncharacterized membrane protein
VTVLTLTIMLLAVFGLLISTYFTAIAYRWIAPDAAWLPPICRLGERTCATVVDTPRARVFGVPNSVLGQIWYAALLVATPLGLTLSLPWWWAFAAGSLGTVLLGAFLTYSLLFVTRVPCRLCFTSHALNLVVFVLLLSARPLA